jgi:hypothetical protein
MPPINGDTPPADLAEPLSTDDMPALAIVGLAFEFPDEATSTEKFWEMICEGRCASSEFPKDRMNAESFYHPDESRQSTVSLLMGSVFGTRAENIFRFQFEEHTSSKRILESLMHPSSASLLARHLAWTPSIVECWR